MRKFVRREVRGPVDSWAEWATVARMLGTTRDAFIVSVLDVACEYFQQTAEKSQLAGREKSPGRGDNHLLKLDRRKRGDSHL